MDLGFKKKKKFRWLTDVNHVITSDDSLICCECLCQRQRGADKDSASFLTGALIVVASKHLT